MNEAEWLACSDWHRMLLFLRRRRGIASRQAGRRKLRLLACGCCRQEWALLFPESRDALETAELFADGRVDDEKRAEAEQQALKAHANSPQCSLSFPQYLEAEQRSTNSSVDSHRSFAALAVARVLSGNQLFEAVEEVMSLLGRLTGLQGTASEQEEWNRATANLVRDVFGNPFRVTRWKRAWRTATVLQIARGIYLEHAFDRMPILGDALQETGCDDEAILSHCRDPKCVHIRGCFVLDLVLGKK